MATEAERREARRQRILARGTDRLASITGEKVAAKREEEGNAEPSSIPEKAAGSISAGPSTAPDASPAVEHAPSTGTAGFADFLLSSQSTRGAPQAQPEFARLAELVNSISNRRGEDGGQSEGNTQSAGMRSPSQLASRMFSALEAAVTATETARVCSSVVFAFVLVFAHYVQACADSTLLGTSPIQRPLLFLCTLNCTIILGWCILNSLSGRTVDDSGGHFEGFGEAQNMFKWLGHVDLAARLLSLVSKITRSVIRDVSFFLVTFGLLWTVWQYALPGICLSRAGVPT